MGAGDEETAGRGGPGLNAIERTLVFILSEKASHCRVDDKIILCIYVPIN